MTLPVSLPENFSTALLMAPTTTNAGASSRGVSMKTLHKGWFTVDCKQAVSDLTAIVLRQATGTSLATSKTLEASRVWYNFDGATSPILAEGTLGTGYILGSGAKDMRVILEVDPAKMDGSGGYDCVYVDLGTSSQATNFANVSFTGYTRYPGAVATQPNICID